MADLVPRDQILYPVDRGTGPQTPPGHYPDEFSITELSSFLLNVVARRMWLIAGIAAVVVLATLIQLFTMSPIYRSGVTLHLEPSPVSTLPEPELSDAEIDFQSTDAYLKAQKEILESDTMTFSVAQALGLESQSAFMEAPARGFLIDQFASLRSKLRKLIRSSSPAQDEAKTSERILARMAEGLEVKIIPGTRIFEIYFSSPSPELAAAVPNEYARQFLVQASAQSTDSAIRTRDFLENKVLEVRSALERSEALLLNYAQGRDIVKLDPNQGIQLQRYADLNREVTEAESRLLEARSQQSVLKDASVVTFPPFLRNDAIIKLEAQRNELQQRLSSLLTQFGRNWPETIRQQEELDQLDQQISSEKEAALTEAQLEYEVRVEHYQLALSRLQQQKRTTDQVGEDLINYNILKGEVETNRLLHDSLLKRLKEARIAAVLESSNVNIFEDARVPQSIHFPSKVQYLALSVMVGLLFGFGVALLFEAVDDSVRSASDVGRMLSAPCLGVIPSLPLAKSQDKGSTSHALTRKDSVPIVSPLFETKEWEPFRFLRTSLLHTGANGSSRVYLVTSAMAGEGKTTIAVNLATAFAKAGIRTLLMDVNLHSPATASMLQIERGLPGLTDFLTEQSNLYSLVRQTEIENLFFLPPGPAVTSSAELMGQQRLQAGLDILRGFFDVIIVDSPALLQYSDALVMAGRINDIIMVVGEGKTAKKKLAEAMSHLQRVNARVMGTVLNAGAAKSLLRRS